MSGSRKSENGRFRFVSHYSGAVARRIPVAILLLLLPCMVSPAGCTSKKSQPAPKSVPFDHSYAAYARLINTYINNGLVDYAGLSEHREALDSLVENIATADLSQTSNNQRLAFYCNSYNILTLRSVVDEYPVESIKDIDGVWDKKKWSVAGQNLTLNEIEHDILRKLFHDPRIHAAINCASIGCPPFLDVPYYPDRLDSLLEVISRRFASSPAHNRIDVQNKTAHLSAIFDWFGEDFIDKYYDQASFPGLSEKENASLNFVVRHVDDPLSANTRSEVFSISYLDYDWSLNDLNH